MEIRYKHKTPFGQPLTIVGEMVRHTCHLTEAKSELRLADGTVAAEAMATYLPVPDEKQQDVEREVVYWKVFPDEVRAGIDGQ